MLEYVHVLRFENFSAALNSRNDEQIDPESELSDLYQGMW